MSENISPTHTYDFTGKRGSLDSSSLSLYKSTKVKKRNLTKTDFAKKKLNFDPYISVENWNSNIKQPNDPKRNPELDR